jgi:hypothetical protein
MSGPSLRNSQFWLAQGAQFGGGPQVVDDAVEVWIGEHEA